MILQDAEEIPFCILRMSCLIDMGLCMSLYAFYNAMYMSRLETLMDLEEVYLDFFGGA